MLELARLKMPVKTKTLLTLIEALSPEHGDLSLRHYNGFLILEADQSPEPTK
jgi:hypothetical protein